MKRIITYIIIFIWIIGLNNLQAGNNIQLRYKLGLAYFNDHEYPQASSLFEQILQQEPDNEQVLKLLGEIYSIKRNYYKAIEYYQKIIQLDANATDAKINMAQLYAWAGSYPEAVKTFKAVLATDSLNIRARIGLGDVYSWLQNYFDARKEYQAVLDIAPENIEALSGLARIAAWKHEFEKSIDYYQKAIALDSANVHLHSALAEVYGWQNKFALAIRQYKKVLAMDPGFVEAYRGLAQVYSWKGKNRQAAETYQKAIQLEPDNVNNYLGLAQIYRWTKQYDKARKVYQKALQIAPQNTRIMQELQALRYEMPYPHVEFLVLFKNFLFALIALVLIYFMRRYQKVIGNLFWFRKIFLRVIPFLAFTIMAISFSSPLLAASYQKEFLLINESMEIISIILLMVSFITLLWILRFGKEENKDVVLAIGAHPDDLEFGCGGTILRYREEGCTVIGVILSGGENGICHGDFRHRIVEAKKGAKILRLNQLFILNFPDSHFKSVTDDIKNVIEQIIQKFQPDIILTHSPDDLHSDHQAVFEATKEAARGPHTILLYENPNTPSTFTPDFFVDISTTLDEKIDAIKKHRTQAKKAYAAPSVIKSMAKFRGTQAKIEYAEAFKAFKVVKNHSKIKYNFPPIKLLPEGIRA